MQGSKQEVLKAGRKIIDSEHYVLRPFFFFFFFFFKHFCRLNQQKTNVRSSVISDYAQRDLLVWWLQCYCFACVLWRLIGPIFALNCLMHLKQKRSDGNLRMVVHWPWPSSVSDFSQLRRFSFVCKHLLLSDEAEPHCSYVVSYQVSGVFWSHWERLLVHPYCVYSGHLGNGSPPEELYRRYSLISVHQALWWHGQPNQKSMYVMHPCLL